MELIRRTKDALKSALRRTGYELRPVGARPPRSPVEEEFRRNAGAIERRHRRQTRADVEALQAKYADPVFGRVRVWDLVQRQAQCVDPSDRKLLLASQEVHVLQMLDAMDRDGVTDRDLVLAALIHDVGKVLLLAGEDPANVVCTNEPIGEYDDGCGLDQCVFQWNHDEFGYMRFKDHVPDHVAWLVRYHSIDPAPSARLMNEQDRAYTEQYLSVLRRYDQDTKSSFTLPVHRLDDYRDVIEEAFPEPIRF